MAMNRTLVAVGLAALSASSVGAQKPPPVVVNVSGLHVLLHYPTARSWLGTTVEVNGGAWTYTIVDPNVTESICINASAFEASRRRRGNDPPAQWAGITLAAVLQEGGHVNTVMLNGSTPVHLLTAQGKPLTREQAIKCVGTLAKD
jgi:hypothetical protein